MRIKQWAKVWGCCQRCGTTEMRHHATGLCRKCYAREHYGEYPSHTYAGNHEARIKQPSYKNRDQPRLWEKRNPERARTANRARKKVQRALAGYKLICVVDGCNAIAIAHHPDYSKPLEIIPLCPHHHRMLHVGRLNTEGLTILNLAEKDMCAAYS